MGKMECGVSLRDVVVLEVACFGGWSVFGYGVFLEMDCGSCFLGME